MERWNPEAFAKGDLSWVLKRSDIVLERRRRGTCLLCAGRPINEAALCDVCMTMLNREELGLVETWTAGVLPD